jgi:uncharacterized protein (TIGR02284 family)
MSATPHDHRYQRLGPRLRLVNDQYVHALDPETGAEPPAGLLFAPVDPLAELDHWRAAYFHRPYAPEGTFVDFEPAYRAAVEEFAARPRAEPFDDAEPRVQAAYERFASGAYRPWRSVRDASRDAWERIVNRTSQTATEARMIDADRLNDILHMLNDSVEGFAIAADKIGNPEFAAACRRYAGEREHLAAELRPLVAAGGRQPATSTEIRGAIARAWMSVRCALGGGDRSIIENIESAEDHAVAAYRRALDSDDLAAESRAVLSRQYPLVKAAHDQFSAWKRSLAET